MNTEKVELIATIVERRNDSKVIRRIARDYKPMMGDRRAKDLETLADILDKLVMHNRKRLKELKQ